MYIYSHRAFDAYFPNGKGSELRYYIHYFDLIM